LIFFPYSKDILLNLTKAKSFIAQFIEDFISSSYKIFEERIEIKGYDLFKISFQDDYFYLEFKESILSLINLKEDFSEISSSYIFSKDSNFEEIEIPLESLKGLKINDSYFINSYLKNDKLIINILKRKN